MPSYSVKKVLRNILKLLIQKLLSALPQSSQTLLPWPRPSSTTLVLSWRHYWSLRGWVPFHTELKAQFLAHLYHIADILPVFYSLLLHLSFLGLGAVLIASGELEEERSQGTLQPSGPSVAPEAEPSSRKLTSESLAHAEPLPGPHRTCPPPATTFLPR